MLQKECSPSGGSRTIQNWLNLGFGVAGFFFPGRNATARRGRNDEQRGRNARNCPQRPQLPATPATARNGPQRPQILNFQEKSLKKGEKTET
jgi:hypothetical protein